MIDKDHPFYNKCKIVRVKLQPGQTWADYVAAIKAQAEEARLATRGQSWKSDLVEYDSELMFNKHRS